MLTATHSQIAVRLFQDSPEFHELCTEFAEHRFSDKEYKEFLGELMVRTQLAFNSFVVAFGQFLHRTISADTFSNCSSVLQNEDTVFFSICLQFGAPFNTANIQFKVERGFCEGKAGSDGLLPIYPRITIEP